MYQRDLTDSATAELDEHVRDRDLFLAKVAAYATADPDNPPEFVNGRGGADEVIVGPSRREREEREAERAQWLDEIKTPAPLRVIVPRVLVKRAPVSRPRGQRTRRVRGPSARGPSRRRSEDPEPPLAAHPYGGVR